MVKSSKKVVDMGCGLGYGSAIIAENQENTEVLGIDNDPGAICYANQNYKSDKLEFIHLNALHVEDIVERSSIDLVVLFETLRTN